MNFTITTFFLPLLLLVFASTYVAGDEDFECVPGVRYMENDCNYCMCSDAKFLGCDLRRCPTHSDPKFRHCQIGTTWFNECNKCWCIQVLGTICTTNKCS